MKRLNEPVRRKNPVGPNRAAAGIGKRSKHMLDDAGKPSSV